MMDIEGGDALLGLGQGGFHVLEAVDNGLTKLNNSGERDGERPLEFLGMRASARDAKRLFDGEHNIDRTDNRDVCAWRIKRQENLPK